MKNSASRAADAPPPALTVMRMIANLFWVALGALSLLVLARVSADYLGTVTSTQEFRWRVAAFDAPAAGAAQTALVLEVRNDSAIALDFKDLEIYLWLRSLTVGKSYGRFETRTVPPHSSLRVPLTIELDDVQLRRAFAENTGSAWRVSGSYKLNAPFAPSDFIYRLALDIAP